MKLEVRKIGEKAKELYGKIGKRTVIIASAVILIAVSVMLNFALWGASEDSGKTPAIDLSNLSASNAEAGETGEVNGEGDDYFTQMVLSRTQARDEAIEVLSGVVNSESAVEQVKTEAQAEINKIAKDIENEANIETLVKSKGFEECIAVISGDHANVIVRTEELSSAQISQISEIVYEQAGIIPTNLRINKNS